MSSKVKSSHGDRRRLLLARGYQLTTAEIIYHLPDHPAMLQSYIWQEYDLPPRFPILLKFLEFWRSNLDGALHSVRVGSIPLVSRRETQYANFEFQLH
jgi:uncharacterized protein Usg